MAERQGQVEACNMLGERLAFSDAPSSGAPTTIRYVGNGPNRNHRSHPTLMAHKLLQQPAVRTACRVAWVSTSAITVMRGRLHLRALRDVWRIETHRSFTGRVYEVIFLETVSDKRMRSARV